MSHFSHSDQDGSSDRRARIRLDPLPPLKLLDSATAVGRRASSLHEHSVLPSIGGGSAEAVGFSPLECTASAGSRQSERTILRPPSRSSSRQEQRVSMEKASAAALFPTSSATPDISPSEEVPNHEDTESASSSSSLSSQQRQQEEHNNNNNNNTISAPNCTSSCSTTHDSDSHGGGSNCSSSDSILGDTAAGEATPNRSTSLFPSPLLSAPNCMDAANDERLQVPYEIHSETFDVPLACPDDHLSGQDRYWVPGKPLRVAYVSWNMANNRPRMGEVSSFGIHPNAHIIIVGTQENGPYIGTNRLQERWARDVEVQCLKNKYTRVGREHMWAIHLMVFARTRDVAQYVSLVESSKVSTGMMGGLGGNKGGVAVALAVSLTPTHDEREQYPAEAGMMETRQSSARSFDFHEDTEVNAAPLSTVEVPSFAAGGGTSLGNNPSTAGPATLQAVALSPRYLTILCITSHLAAHQGAVNNRNRDYRQIVRKLRVGLRGRYRKLYKRLLNGENEPEEAPAASTGGGGSGNCLQPQRGGGHSGEGENDDVTVASDSGSEFDDDDDDDEEDEVDMLPLPSTSLPASAVKPTRVRRDVTNEFDLTLFGGDLNYRINGTRQAIEYIIHHHRNIRSILINNDQLTLERAKGVAFRGFDEGTLYFRPTYKYEVSSTVGGGNVTLDEYNFSRKKNRMPAYCDRVLFKRNATSTVQRIVTRLYTDVPNVRTSDHRPVVALFDIKTDGGSGGT